MPKPPPKPTLFPDASRPTPPTVTVEQAVESGKTGVPIDPPPQPPPRDEPAEETEAGDRASTAESAQEEQRPEQPPLPPQQPPAQLAQREPVSFNPTNADEMYRYVRMLARSRLLPKSFYARNDYEKKNPFIDDVHFVCLKGQYLGLHPMVSIGNINIIDGKAEVGSLLMLAMVRKSGLCGGWKLVHSDERRAVFKTLRRGDEEWTDFEYTIEEAEQMGLLDKGRDEEARAKNQWRKQPRTMLRRRATSMLLREVYPDIVIGLYDHGELEEMREREIALGIDPDRVIPMNSMGTGDPAEPKPSSGDPLKDRLAARAGRVRRCSKCDSVLDPRDSDPCIACKGEPPPVSVDDLFPKDGAG